MTDSTVLRDILAGVVPPLRERGFKGSGQNFRLAGDDAVVVVNFQKSSRRSRFYVNVGLQPLRIPTEREIAADVRRIVESECVFRTRLAPPNVGGWHYSVDQANLLRDQLIMLLSSVIEPLMAIPGPLTQATVSDFDPESDHFVFGTRWSRRFLHFSRLALAYGDQKKAHEYAEMALETCGERATALRPMIRRALASAAEPAGRS